MLQRQIGLCCREVQERPVRACRAALSLRSVRRDAPGAASPGAGDALSAAAAEVVRLGPQPGPQTSFLSSLADIVIFGGAAGGGKSYGLLLEPLRHFNNPSVGAVIFRRNSTHIRNQGGLWDESLRLYRQLGGYPREYALKWTFPSGMSVKFAHLEHEKSVYDHQGAQIPLLGFDELTHFTQFQYLFMFARLRASSLCPDVTPRIRSGTNPGSVGHEWVLERFGP